LWAAGRSSVEVGIQFGCWAALFLLVWSFASWWLMRRTLFEPYPAFLLAAFLFNTGHAVLDIFGANAKGFLFDRVGREEIYLALLLVIVSLSWLHLGALIAVSRRGARRLSAAARARSGFAARMVGAVLLAICWYPAFLTLKTTLTRSLTAGYMSTYQQDFATGVGAGADVLAAFLVPAALFLLAGSVRQPAMRLIPVGIIGLVVFTNLAIGARITAVMALFALAWQWHHTVRRIQLQWLVVAGLTMMFVVFPVVRGVRDGSGSDRYSVTALTDSFRAIENPVVEIVSEMGFSMSTVAYTLELVPERRSFDYGVSYGYAVLAVIPNIFWSLHPTVAHGLAADWLIWEVDPSNAARQVGLGYSFIAEAYLNFGWFGAPLVMLVVGFGVVSLTRWATEYDDPVRFAAVAAFMTFFLRFPRGESAGVIRPLIWYGLLPYLSVRLIDHFRHSQQSIRQRVVDRKMPTGVDLEAEAYLR
jgi:oligosaccharide repeat unit polymerase